MICFRRSESVIRSCGSMVKIWDRIDRQCDDTGRIFRKNAGLVRKALKDSSEGEAIRHGFRPQTKLTRMIPSDQTSPGWVG
jgi:hypothetical protein